VTEQEAIALAKAFAEERGWVWVEPARAVRLPAKASVPERWEVWSHARGGLGAMARVVIDAATGAVIDQGYVSR
jgi:hypothetical protein